MAAPKTNDSLGVHGFVAWRLLTPTPTPSPFWCFISRSPIETLTTAMTVRWPLSAGCLRLADVCLLPKGNWEALHLVPGPRQQGIQSLTPTREHKKRATHPLTLLLPFTPHCQSHKSSPISSAVLTIYFHSHSSPPICVDPDPSSLSPFDTTTYPVAIQLGRDIRRSPQRQSVPVGHFTLTNLPTTTRQTTSKSHKNSLGQTLFLTRHDRRSLEPLPRRTSTIHHGFKIL